MASPTHVKHTLQIILLADGMTHKLLLTQGGVAGTGMAAGRDQCPATCLGQAAAEVQSHSYDPALPAGLHLQSFTIATGAFVSACV